MTADALVITQLSDDLARLEAQCVTYRAMAVESLALLHQAQMEWAALDARYQALRDEMRRYLESQVTCDE